MSETIKLQCTNAPHCNHINVFPKSDLVSGIPLKDDEGNVINEHPEVELDGNTFIRCENCGYPIRCVLTNDELSD